MKNLLKAFLCALVIMAMALPVAGADESPMNTKWKGSYTGDTEIVITFKSPALYPQQISVVMYDDSKEYNNLVFSDYLRMAEVLSVNGEETTFSIRLGNDLNAADGKYKITLRGNGHLAARSTETITVTILTPSKKASALASINAATTADTLATALGTVKEALQMNLPADPAELNRLMTEVIKVRNSVEYNGNFAVLNDVSDAYAKAEIIVYLESETVTADGLIERVENNATLFGFDKTDEDYIANKESIYNKVISLKNTYKTTGIKTWQQLIQAVEETTGVEYINNTEIDDMADAVAKYKTLVGISDSSYTTYLTLSDVGKEKALRQVYASNFSTVEQIKAAFEAGVTAALEGGGDLGGGGTPSGDKTEININDGSIGGGEVTPPQVNDGIFSDMSKSHWSHTYVESLNKAGIISGYPDGTFKPEKTVSREEFIKMIVVAAGLHNPDAECDFYDVDKNNYFYSYVASAKEAGISSGISKDAFGAGMPIKREDVALICARILDNLKNTDYATKENASTGFSDNNVISEYAMSGVSALVDLGIINGFEDNSFRPAEFLTRAQASKIIYMIRTMI